MFRYITVTSNGTVGQISATEFENGIKVFIPDNYVSTFMNTPWLCWVDKDDSGNYIIHVPADAPRPTYEQSIKEFEDQLNELQNSATNFKSQLDAEQKKNQALIAQIRAMQAQNQSIATQLAALSADDQAKTDALNSANAKLSGTAQAQTATAAPTQQ